MPICKSFFSKIPKNDGARFACPSIVLRLCRLQHLAGRQSGAKSLRRKKFRRRRGILFQSPTVSCFSLSSGFSASSGSPVSSVSFVPADFFSSCKIFIMLSYSSDIACLSSSATRFCVSFETRNNAAVASRNPGTEQKRPVWKSACLS